jgi:GDP-4-dehydro-6-deoxy-D-mannose reductase
MKAFITGVTGFAGRYLAEHLLAAGDEVLGCSASGVWPADTTEDLRRRVPLLIWDIGNPQGLTDETRQNIAAFAPDVVYHLSALSIPEDCGDTEPTPRAWQVNVEGTSRVLDLAAALQTKPRILFTSTSHVYAPITSADARLDEQAPLGPRRAYGQTKLAAEERVRAAGQSSGLDVLIVRAFQHTGPHQGPRMMLPQWARQFAQSTGKPVEVYNRDTYIDLTDVRDVVRAYRLLALHGQTSETYNVGSGISRRTGDILEILLRVAGSREIVELRPGRRQDPIADIRRLSSQTSWQPQISIEQTVRDTLDFWQGRELG